MKNVKIIVLALVMILISCKTTKNKIATQNKDQVEYENALQEISWLQDIKRQFDLNMGMSKQRIIQYNYNNEIVFLIDNCFKCADALTVVYDVKKNIVCEFGGIRGKNTCPEFDKNATNIKVLYEE